MSLAIVVKSGPIDTRRLLSASLLWESSSANFSSILLLHKGCKKGYLLLQDTYSYKIVQSKHTDLALFFYDYIKQIFNDCEGQNANLICVAPSSEVGQFSPTLLQIAEKLSTESGVLNENIIVKAIKKEKMTTKIGYDSRFHAVDGTFAVTRRLKDNEKKILILDDTKVSGCTVLECAKMLIPYGAQKFISICLGINSTSPR